MAYTVLSYNKSQAQPRRYRTLSLLVDDEPLSDAQLKAYQTRLQEYRTFLEAVGRLAACGNVCITEEAVMIGDNGLLTGESLNALQHAGAISVYNTLQLNNWEFPVPEDGEVAIVKQHNPVPDDFLDSERPIRHDWPSVHVSECFVEGDRAKLHGSVRPLRTFLPPTVTFRNAADIDEDAPDPEPPATQLATNEGAFEIMSTEQGLVVRRGTKDSKMETIPLEEYYFGRQEGNVDYAEEKGEFRFRCAACNKMFYSNVKLMYHMLGHVDETSQANLNAADLNQCRHCFRTFGSAFDLRTHQDHTHPGLPTSGTGSTIPLPASSPEPAPQTASQLLMQQQQQLGSRGAAAPQGRQLVAGPTSCLICGKETPTVFALAHHLQMSHRQREMPYGCRLCNFRSSLYEDILDHFKKAHGGSNHLLCTYCLRIFTISDASLVTGGVGAGSLPLTSNMMGGVGQTHVFLQHLRMHQARQQCRKCQVCRLNFTNKSDYQVHRKLDHKSALSSAAAIGASGSASAALLAQQEALMDAKMETYEMEVEEGEAIELAPSPNSAAPLSAATLPSTAQSVSSGALVQTATGGIVRMNAPEPARVKSLAHIALPEALADLPCIECGQPLANTEHKRYLPCSLCRFATCCSLAFARHIRLSHTDDGLLMEEDDLPSGTRRKHSPLEDSEGATTARDFFCTNCAISGLGGNTLARHLVEECGVSVVTLRPDPELVAAREEAERELLLQRQAVSSSILFAPSAPRDDVHRTEGATTDQSQEMEGDGDTEADARGLLLTASGELATAMIATGEGEEEGEMVQQLVLPEGLTLEEGQCLVMIRGEDGETQLAIVNQADLIGPDGEPVTLQAEDEQGTVYLYGDTQIQQAGAGEEKENEYA